MVSASFIIHVSSTLNLTHVDGWMAGVMNRVDGGDLVQNPYLIYIQGKNLVTKPREERNPGGENLTTETQCIDR